MKMTFNVFNQIDVNAKGSDGMLNLEVNPFSAIRVDLLIQPPDLSGSAPAFTVTLQDSSDGVAWTNADQVTISVAGLYSLIDATPKAHVRTIASCTGSSDGEMTGRLQVSGTFGS